MNNCVLCQQVLTNDPWLFQPDQRRYFLCDHCFLIQVPHRFFPKPDEEKSRYLHHIQDAGSPGHITFLQQAVVPSLTFMSGELSCLDYGCGPLPVLSEILSKYHFNCDSYDPYFFPEIRKNIRYDQIFCLETAEHFFYPKKEFTFMNQILKPGGYLTFMTEWYPEKSDFEHWYYKRDHTHVVFYHQKTWEFISKTFGWTRVYSDDKRVIIFKKSS